MSDSRRPTSDSSPHPIGHVLSRQPRPCSLLNDEQIRDFVAATSLIGGGYLPAAARYASYELHASDVVQRLSVKEGATAYVDMDPHDGCIVIPPRTTVRVYSSESINLPNYMFADVTVLGQLFGAGLSAGSTYVDPGSSGEIYIALTNLNDCSLRIPVGSPLARVQFFVLGDPAQASHGGPESRRPIRFQVGPQEESASDADNESHRRQESAVQARLDALGAQVARLKLGIYVLLTLVLATLMAVQNEQSNRLFGMLLGDGFPPVFKFFIPPFALAVFLLLSRDARRTSRDVWKHGSHSLSQRVKDWLKG